MDSLFLILSGAFVGPELVAEFGHLPPAFLPNGVRRLYEDQIGLGKSMADRVAITVPDGFSIPLADQELLETAGVQIVRSDPGLSLGAALAYALRETTPQGHLFLLFGDTLFKPDGPSRGDTFGFGLTRHNAVWADFSEGPTGLEFRQSLPTNTRERKVVAGFFDFTDGPLFQACLGDRPDYVSGLNTYAQARALTPVPLHDWLDFGHLHTYYRSRRRELAARAFNRLTADGLSITKTGEPQRKIYAEAQWYQALPADLKLYAPRFLTARTEPECAYEIEYLHQSTISELYIFGDLARGAWSNIFSSCQHFLDACRSHPAHGAERSADYANRFFDQMVALKTRQRLEQFARAGGVDLDRSWTFKGRALPSLNALTDRLLERIPVTKVGDLCLWHGDLHFANMFFDFRAQRINVVDPRGMIPNGDLAMYGDHRYDLAKLTHSAIGLYDFIIAGRYQLSEAGAYDVDLDFDVTPRLKDVMGDFNNAILQSSGYDPDAIVCLSCLLFLSMLPLHADRPDRQRAMIANALRLFAMADASS